MDETLRMIEWSSFHHAYGTADDIPEAIESLKSSDPAVRENALDHLSVMIYHQGDLYSATAPAVTALIRLAANEQKPDRPDILGYDPVYRGLEGTEYGTVTAFAAAHPTMTFGQLASRLGKRISAQQV
jgi:hypothetical protein